MWRVLVKEMGKGVVGLADQHGEPIDAQQPQRPRPLALGIQEGRQRRPAGQQQRRPHPLGHPRRQSIIIATPGAFLFPIQSPRQLKEHTLRLETGQEISRDILAYRLLENIMASQIRLDKFEIREPSLHEIFIDKVGEQ